MLQSLCIDALKMLPVQPPSNNSNNKSNNIAGKEVENTLKYIDLKVVRNVGMLSIKCVNCTSYHQNISFNLFVTVFI